MFTAQETAEIRNIIRSIWEEEINPNPMTTLADLIVGGASGALSRLGIGSANQRLFINAAGNGLEYGFGSKVVAYTRDMEAVSGDVAYTGAGFKPRSIIVLATYIASFCIGFGDINNSNWRVLLYDTNLAVTHFTTSSIFILTEDAAVTKYQEVVLKSLDADGCTLTFTKGGTPAAGTGNFVVMYLR